jgi:hypothetical protein
MEPLNPYFQEDCQELIRGHFGADESLVWAKECGYQDCFGYVVVSNKRVITAVFDPQVLFGGKRKRVSFSQPKSGLWGKLSTFPAERSTFLAPDSELSGQETKKRRLYEAPLAKITSVERQDYRVKLKSGETTMVEITFVAEEEVVIDRPLLYTQEAGDELFELVKKMIGAETAVSRGSGPTIFAQNPVEDTASLIASLLELHEAGVLSDEEFAVKKQAILSKK